MKKIIGIICVVVGVILLMRGHDIGQSIGSQLQKTFTGSPDDKSTYYYIGGAVLSLGGLFLIFGTKK